MGFEEAFKALSETKMLAPAYFVLGGNSSSQGAIVTRSSAKAVNVVRLRQPATRWFLLQTNYDNWTQTPFYDKRREAGDHCMAQMSVLGTSFQGLFSVLSSQPVLNKLTVYSALMSVNDGHLETWLQDCADPCTPFWLMCSAAHAVHAAHAAHAPWRSWKRSSFQDIPVLIAGV